MKSSLSCLLILWLLGITQVSAILFWETGSPTHNTSSAGDNTGWQYVGTFNTTLGVPIAPFFFITAKHVGGSIGSVFTWHGDSYVTTAVHLHPTNDLAIWQVAADKPFPNYATLQGRTNQNGNIATVFGRGTQRGEEVIVGGELKGWKWGAADLVQRWGRNTVAATVSDPTLGNFLQFDFDRPSITDECHLSVYDSGGSVFINHNGLCTLAAINYGVDGPFRASAAEVPYSAALFDAGGLEYNNGVEWVAIADTLADVSSSFYCSQIAYSLPWIQSITGYDGTQIMPENYAAWQPLYFTPAEIANTSLSGPEADYDGDGISNLLEFACHLDPTFSQQTTMPASAGFAGLPHIAIETVSGKKRLVLRYVRRKSTSGVNLSYIPEFSNDLINWSAAGTTAFPSSINSRWERMRFTDAVTITSQSKRFARLRVVMP